MQKDTPAAPPSKEDLQEEYKSDPDTFKEKYGVPDDPTVPPPPSGNPVRQ